MNFSLLDQGLVRMLSGMGTVFVFQAALVLAMNLLARFVLLLPPAMPAASTSSTDELAAIAAAIHPYRRRTKPHE
jgi:Na+-transporting methylmalonyl-CoA/oxaloacetate decarboxylase gamma subunit